MLIRLGAYWTFQSSVFVQTSASDRYWHFSSLFLDSIFLNPTRPIYHGAQTNTMDSMGSIGAQWATWVAWAEWGPCAPWAWVHGRWRRRPPPIPSAHSKAQSTVSVSYSVEATCTRSHTYSLRDQHTYIYILHLRATLMAIGIYS